MRFRRMPRYYFHLHNDMDVADHEGKDLSSLGAAREWAGCQARVMFGEMVKEQGRAVLHHRIDIEDEDGAVLDSVQFGDVVKIEA